MFQIAARYSPSRGIPSWYVVKMRRGIISAYQHVNMPPDLNLHISGGNPNAKSIWFREECAIDVAEGRSQYLRWFTYVGSPLSKTRPIIGGTGRKKMGPSRMYLLGADELGDGEHTRLVADFYLHRATAGIDVGALPLTIPGTRLSKRPIHGPFSFYGFHRQGVHYPALAWTVRLGLTEPKDQPGDAIHISMPERPPR
jgi:hypothetical protein